MSANNTTLSFPNVTPLPTDNATLGALYLVTSLLVMFSNAIVVVVVVASRELYVPTLWNTAFMGLCDFTYGLHYLMFAVPSAFMNKFAYPKGLIAPTSCLLTLLYGQNILNTVVATCDRYLCVCWPLRYSDLMTAKRFAVAIAVTVAVNITRLCLIIVPRVNVHYNPFLAVCGARFTNIVSALASTGLPAVSVVVIAAFLLRILSEFACSRRRILPVGSEPRNRQFTVTIVISAGLFCLSYVPTSVSIILNLLYGQGSVSLDFVKFGTICLLSNSLWNVVIYATTFKPFRDAFLRLFCKNYYRKKRLREDQGISHNERNLEETQGTSVSEDTNRTQ